VTGDEPFSADLGAMYRPLILLMQPGPVYHTVINTFKGPMILKLLHAEQHLEFIAQYQ
jgi:hypothetical protein